MPSTFLQGLVTSDVEKLGDGLMYTALLTPQGKYIADFFLFRRGRAIMLDVDNSLAADLIKRLNMYKLRADVTISETGLKVWRGTGQRPRGRWTIPATPIWAGASTATRRATTAPISRRSAWRIAFPKPGWS